MSKFNKGDLVVTQKGKVFEVGDVDGELLYSSEGSVWCAKNCRHLKSLDDTKEIQLVDKPKPPVFDPSRCNVDLRGIDVIAMDADGEWRGHYIAAGDNFFRAQVTHLYIDTPSPSWRETKTYVGGDE